MTTDQRVKRIIDYFAGNWKNVPMDKVARFVKNEFLDERESALKVDKNPLQQQLYEALKAVFDDNCFYHKSGDERAYRLATEAIRKAEGK